MIDKLQRTAQAIQFLRLPSIVAGIVCLASIVMIVLISRSHDGDRYLMPSFVGFIWAATTYSFIATFRTIPEEAHDSLGFIGKIKQKFARGWHWLISFVFLGTTITAFIMTVRLISVWLKDYVN